MLRDLKSASSCSLECLPELTANSGGSVPPGHLIDCLPQAAREAWAMHRPSLLFRHSWTAEARSFFPHQSQSQSRYCSATNPLMADCLPTLMGAVGCQVLLAAAPGSAIILPRYSSGTRPMSGQQAALSGEFLWEREREYLPSQRILITWVPMLGGLW